MKIPKLPLSLPTGSPAGEVLKIASYIAATVLVKRLEKMLKETTNLSNTSFVDYTGRKE